MIAEWHYRKSMHLELTNEQTEVLIRLLSRTIDDDRYPLSPRITTLKIIVEKLRPEDHAGVDCERLAANQPLGHAALDSRLEYLAQQIALAETAMPVL